MKRPKINEKEAGGVPFKKPSSCLHQCLFLHIIFTDLAPKSLRGDDLPWNENQLKPVSKSR